MSCRLSCLVVMICVLMAGSTASFAEDPDAVAWQSLFDGQSLNGWEQHSGEAKYAVEEGCIVGTSVPNTGNSFLCTTKTYSDFVFECEFNVENLNSGVQFRSEFFDEAKEIDLGDGKTRKVPADRVHGYQCEIDCGDKPQRMWTGCIYDESRRGWLFPGSKGGDGEKLTEQGIRIIDPAGWNKFRIECQGDSIKTYLNGELRADFRDDLTPAGVIALQVHGIGKSEQKLGKQVRWRGLRIKDLSGK